MAKAVIEGGSGVEIPAEEAKRLADLLSSGVKATASARESGSPAATQAANLLTSQFYAQQGAAEAAAEAAANKPKPSVKKETKRFYLGKGKQRMLVVQYDDGTEEQTPSPEPGSDVTETASNLTGVQENAIELLKRTFAGYGLESLADTITDLVRKGYSGDTVSLMLQDTPAYKQRFAANDARKKAGLPVLSPAEYLSAEKSYRQVMQAAGLPKGFYDSSDDFQKFLANDMSPSELNARVQSAAEVVNNADPLYASQLQRLYGIDKGMMIANALDPERALPLIQRQANAVTYATAAAQQGLQVGAQPSEYFADLGVTGAQARAGFANIAETLPTYEKLQQIYGGTGTGASLAELQSATFGGTGQTEAQKRIKQAGKQELATFSAQSGLGQTAFGTSPTAGAL